MRGADLAMYDAKDRGCNGLAFYDSGMSDALRSRTALESELRLALERHEFEVFHQPLIDVPTGRIVGAEAPTRAACSWRSPRACRSARTTR